MIEKIRNGQDPNALIHLRSSPINTVNQVFEAARFAVKLDLSEVGISVVRAGATYQIDKLSDGERAALFIVSAMVNRVNPGVVIIDEPERHLHPSISAPLISGAVRSSSKNAYVFASHDLGLIETLEADRVIYLRDSQIIQEMPERRIYDLHYPTGLMDISQDLKRDILGARDNVLFVEGEATSLDMPLYSACYPNWKISPRGGFDKVQEAAKALTENNSLHWINAIGIVDGDGRNVDEIATLREAKILVLSTPSIENLFFLKDVVEVICRRTSDLDGTDPTLKIQAIQSSLTSLISVNLEEIVCRRTAWIANRTLSTRKISVADVRDGVGNILGVDVNAIQAIERERFQSLLDAGVVLNDLETLPIKNTGIPAKLASMAGCSSLKKYKDTVLHQIDSNSISGIEIKAAIMRILPVIG